MYEKIYHFCIFFVLAMLKTQAQDYLISFVGTGDTTEVSTIKVDNLISGTVTLNGEDILHLIMLGTACHTKSYLLCPEVILYRVLFLSPIREKRFNSTPFLRSLLAVALERFLNTLM